MLKKLYKVVWNFMFINCVMFVDIIYVSLSKVM